MSFNAINQSQAEDVPTLFQGARFWLSQTIPQRSTFKELIKKHGGTVVLMEGDADVKLVDHTRKNLPSDTFSYQYVERSIQKRQLEDLEAHRAGPSKPRPMGASNIPTKGTRTFYNLKEDQLLFDWVEHFKQEPGAPVQGNRIYQELGELYPSHSWQSWRSRYIKHLNGKDRPGGGVPRSHEELIQSAPAQGQYPKTLPTRTETAPKEKMSSGVSQPQSSALTPNNTMISSKRKRDPVPAVSNPSRTQVSPSKRRAIEASTSTGSLFLRGSDQTCGPQPRSPTITTPPGLTQGPTRDTHGTSSSSRRPIEGLGLVNLPTQTLPTQSPQQTAHGPALRPEDNAQKPARVPRPLGDNAFAKFGRFKKQEHKAAPPVADPYKNPVDPVFLELPFLPSSPASEVAEEDTEEIPDVDSWIDQRLARGANESHVFDALRCTSMIPEMADRVLESLAAGNDIPNDIPGVWTAEDDQCLQAQDHSEVQRALSKHGSEAFKERWEYLRMARETGLID